ncbi:3-deoxy-D-manno-octulosonic acid kinase [Marinobacter sp. X15-166B]|uniref:3-deoxy-D-manno-octulosonic acid kinase n=1 Tax=Marinobacter sp. X15-166B TaxID=1897620 RepID=UPI00085BC3D4|nr:3-deoxy-D-manno-octulosonic acid kinase [Marinobacter sp. X15-166B]OEY66593.1 hypothetical protein BG841_09080 [Marinobacter sp. X15-166B]
MGGVVHRVETRYGVCLIGSGYTDAGITSDWFQPDYWGGRARPVTSGGRGSAWFVEAAGTPMVLRRYLRGGMAAKLLRSSYLYTSEDRVRSFAELRLLEHLIDLQLPVPAPVAAWYGKTSGAYYQAGIIIERIADAVPLADLIDTLALDGWAALGSLLRRFHDAGVKHADLNCYNILVRQKEFYLIDFDKGQLMGAGRSQQWKAASLERLARSLRKVAGAAAQQRVWDTMMAGYERSTTSE